MKSVLISIRPQWCEKIASGKKTIEVRKTAPKEVPFKAYIYCTKGKDGYEWLYRVDNNGYGKAQSWHGKVIGEFICDKVDNFYCVSVPYQRENNLGYGQFIDNGVYKVNNWHEGIAFERNDRYIDTMLNNNDLKKMCLTAQELFNYIGVGKHLYSWHITDLKIYDKPRKLSEFFKRCPTKEKGDCLSCDCLADNDFGGVCTNNLIRPPQSWCYVEEIETR
jgi:predicted transcriptional regulator|nr:MAG TPA: helix-turn-helix domain-containing protein [Caudoviricetes sp.]